MNAPTSRITSKAQTVIPKRIRQQLGLKPGDAHDIQNRETVSTVFPLIQGAVKTLKRLLRSVPSYHRAEARC